MYKYGRKRTPYSGEEQGVMIQMEIGSYSLEYP